MIVLSPVEAQVVRLAEAKRQQAIEVAGRVFAADVQPVLDAHGVTGGTFASEGTDVTLTVAE